VLFDLQSYGVLINYYRGCRSLRNYRASWKICLRGSCLNYLVLIKCISFYRYSF
jgi:hypothetical protein